MSVGKKEKINVLSLFDGMSCGQIALNKVGIEYENYLVVDLTMGSCSSGIACINTNRNYILIEKEQKYFDIINERIDKYKQQRAGEFSFENAS